MGNVWTTKVVLEFRFGYHISVIFSGPKTVTFAISVHLWKQKNGTYGGPIKKSKTTFLVQTFPKYGPMAFISWIYPFWVRFWPIFNLGDFWAYFVKWYKYKMPECARKECSNRKVEENKSGFEFNFTLEFKCPERCWGFCLSGNIISEP